MSEKLDLTGRTFGDLYVIKGVNKTIRPNAKNEYTIYECRCICNKIKNVSAVNLLKENGTRSCGCLKIRSNLSEELFPGKKFGRLTVIEFSMEKELWKFECNCENKTICYYNANRVSRGNTQSCGCLRSETASERASIRNFNNRKYHPSEATAKMIYNRDYSDGDLQFEDFLKLTQLNCYYCDIPPSNINNTMFSERSSNYYKENCSFTYNGLDRIDNNLPHNLNNLVPCCEMCNFSKRAMDQISFIGNIKRIGNHNIRLSFEEYRKLASSNMLLFSTQFINTIKGVYDHNYDDGDLTLEQFYELSQLPCYYCGLDHLHSNKTKISRKVDKGYFYYNGIDRIDSKLKHNYNNLIPCCWFCNSSKRKMPIENFLSWPSLLKLKYSQ
jgi:hypothetical protein